MINWACTRAHRVWIRLCGAPEEIGLDAPHLYRWSLYRECARLKRSRWEWLRTVGGCRVYLHHHVASDGAHDPHDHPKGFISIGLRGGYVEEVWSLAGTIFHNRHAWRMDEKYKFWRAPWCRRFGSDHIHRLMLEDGRTAWTLVVTLPMETTWGFYTQAGASEKYRTWIKHDDYIALHNARRAA